MKVNIDPRTEMEPEHLEMWNQMAIGTAWYCHRDRWLFDGQLHDIQTEIHMIHENLSMGPNYPATKYTVVAYKNHGQWKDTSIAWVPNTGTLNVDCFTYCDLIRPATQEEIEMVRPYLLNQLNELSDHAARRYNELAIARNALGY